MHHLPVSDHDATPPKSPLTNLHARSDRTAPPATPAAKAPTLPGRGGLAAWPTAGTPKPQRDAHTPCADDTHKQPQSPEQPSPSAHYTACNQHSKPVARPESLTPLHVSGHTHAHTYADTRRLTPLCFTKSNQVARRSHGVASHGLGLPRSAQGSCATPKVIHFIPWAPAPELGALPLGVVNWINPSRDWHRQPPSTQLTVHTCASVRACISNRQHIQ